ncbi:hypothetical protein DPMN_030794 [Dreissena polymorpha]|uniref:Uncharacterized protein n=1 Tax=Dreissena polymorpha TaxID=45954 RepID=A0A9D4RIE8_DREPO|nr:hypothetical protein DPMN_030794 [Dreissena polymorpha]
MTGTSASENTAFIRTAPASKATLNTSSNSLSSQVEVDAVPDVRMKAPELVTGSQLEGTFTENHWREIDHVRYELINLPSIYLFK